MSCAILCRANYKWFNDYFPVIFYCFKQNGCYCCSSRIPAIYKTYHIELFFVRAKYSVPFAIPFDVMSLILLQILDIECDYACGFVMIGNAIYCLQISFCFHFYFAQTNPKSYIRWNSLSVSLMTDNILKLSRFCLPMVHFNNLRCIAYLDGR